MKVAFPSWIIPVGIYNFKVVIVSFSLHEKRSIRAVNKVVIITVIVIVVIIIIINLIIIPLVLL